MKPKALPESSEMSQTARSNCQGPWKVWYLAGLEQLKDARHLITCVVIMVFGMVAQSRLC